MDLARSASARLGAHQAEQFSLPRRRGRPADRTFHKCRAFRAHLGSERGWHLGGNGTHFDEQFAFHVACKQTFRSVVHGIDRSSVGQHRDRRLDCACEFSRCRCHFRARFGERSGLFGRTIPHGHVVPDFHEAGCNRSAHHPKTCNANSHTSSFGAFGADDRRSRTRLKDASRARATRQPLAQRIRRNGTTLMRFASGDNEWQQERPKERSV